MSDPRGSWFAEWTQRIVNVFSRREVKTPLAFFFRCLSALIVICCFALYLALPQDRMRIFLVVVGMCLLLIAVVGLFAWFKPKNLVYGESGHRAELKLGFGTEKGEISPGEVGSLPATTNPLLPPSLVKPPAIDGGTR